MLTVLGIFALFLVAGIVFVVVQVNTLLSPDVRSERTLDEFVERGVPRPRAHDVAFGGESLRAYATGDAFDQQRPLVVFVHGSPGDWTDFVNQLADPALRDAARLVSIDRPGYGGSDFGDPEPSLRRHAEAVVAVVDHFGPPAQGAVLVGHSMGGPIVTRVAMDFADRVAAVVSVAGSADPALEPTHWYQEVAAWPWVRPLLPTMLDVCNQELLPHRAELRAMAPRWSAIDCPVFVVQGGEDVLVPAANADFIAARVPPDLLHVDLDPTMNHFVPWSHPERMRAAILEALAVTRDLQRAG